MTEPLTPKDLAEITARWLKYDELVHSEIKYDDLVYSEWALDNEAHECAEDVPRLLAEITRMRAENARLLNRVDMLEEEMWPFEWVVATEERERRKAAEARVKELEWMIKDKED